jgi:hypothetical protein
MYEPTGYRYPFAPTKGFGQVIQTPQCPSLEQLMGITDPTDPCQSAGTVSSGSINTGCYNVATGTYQTCPVSGVTATATPAANGPFGLPISFQWNWAVVALLAGSLVVVAAMSGSGSR